MKPDAADNLFGRRFWLGEVDSRPLALFRICYAALLLKDALYHLPLAERLYSDQGILPRYALFSLRYASYRFSLMDALGPAALVGSQVELVEGSRAQLLARDEVLLPQRADPHDTWAA